MMKKLIVLTLLVGCSSEKAKEAPAPEPAPVMTPEPAPVAVLKVTGIEPATGTEDGGQVVAIRGQGFNAVVRGVKVYFGDKPAAVDRMVGDGEIQVAAPPGKEGEVVDVLIVFEPGGEMQLPKAFTYGPSNGAPKLAKTGSAGAEGPAGAEGKVALMSASDAELAAAFTRLDGRKLGALVESTDSDQPPSDGALTREEIDKVIKSRAGLMRACYQKELDRKPELSGKVVVSFTIGGDGKVTRATLARPATTLDDEAVTSCVLRQFQRLVFPAKGAVANVNYPLVFANAK